MRTRSAASRWTGTGIVLSVVLLGATAASAVSVALAPGGSMALPSTTAATEPSLAGVVLHDALLSFKIVAPTGRLICAGTLQDRVVRSTATKRLDFYYLIRNTSGTGQISAVQTTNFGGGNAALRVAWRLDGIGTVAPRNVTRSGGLGAVVTFRFTDPPLSCARHQMSRFALIRTLVTSFAAGGKTRIMASGGGSATLSTVQPK